MDIVAALLWQQLAKHKNYRSSQYRFRIDFVRNRNSYNVQDERSVLLFPSKTVKPDSDDTTPDCPVTHFCGLSSSCSSSPCCASSLLLIHILNSSCHRDFTDNSKRPTGFIKSSSNPRMTSDRVRLCCCASLFISDMILLE